MILATIGVVFIAALIVGMTFVLVVIPPDDPARERLNRLWQDAKSAVPAIPFRQKQKERAQRVLEDVGKIVPASTKDVSRTSFLMIRAGFRKSESIVAFQGAKLIFPIVTLSLVYFTGFYKINSVLILVLASLIGYLLPDFWLTSRIRKRQAKIIAGMPDALDLLTVCVEAGLGLDQAIFRVSQEIQITCPELSEELKLMNMEARFGKGRADAMRDLGTRTGVDDIKTAVAMLIQTDRFGTDLAKSLRVHSETMRMKRRQRAEEKANKASVKMVPVLVFFIFPAMFVVILGPAVIQLIRTFNL
ncbi:MAG TPA: type II secretion system F family protein [Candidatus Acidoferrales bacterium]|jgi:tight adherence protein C|nr:type II secretion system F family protein [Candidatus Acidoferrales bacterium]